MSKSFITIHILNDIPWSNLNRDDTGTPKRTILGGVERGLLSSQSIKRAARKDYEDKILATFPEDFVAYEGIKGREEVAKASSIRSRYLVTWAARRAESLANKASLPFNTKKAERAGNAIVKKLTGGEDTILWLSIEELEALAKVLMDEVILASITDATKDKEVLDSIIKENRKTGALAIAAFGRMFASAQHKQTDAAIAVSPAISTHGSLVETDYFIAGDDYGFFKKDKKTGEVVENYEGAGAAHLDTALYTNGIFYRTVTIDVKELHRNWSGMTSENAEAHLRQLVESLIRALPTGKKNSTAPYTVPTLVIAEEQNYREAYSIAMPMSAEAEGGFLKPSVKHLRNQQKLTREFNAHNYGEVVSSGSESAGFENAVSLEELVDAVVSWILVYKEPIHLERIAIEESGVEGEGNDIFDEAQDRDAVTLDDKEEENGILPFNFPQSPTEESD